MYINVWCNDELYSITPIGSVINDVNDALTKTKLNYIQKIIQKAGGAESYNYIQYIYFVIVIKCEIFQNAFSKFCD